MFYSDAHQHYLYMYSLLYTHALEGTMSSWHFEQRMKTLEDYLLYLSSALSVSD